MGKYLHRTQANKLLKSPLTLARIFLNIAPQVQNKEHAD